MAVIYSAYRVGVGHRGRDLSEVGSRSHHSSCIGPPSPQRPRPPDLCLLLPHLFYQVLTRDRSARIFLLSLPFFFPCYFFPPHFLLFNIQCSRMAWRRSLGGRWRFDDCRSIWSMPANYPNYQNYLGCGGGPRPFPTCDGRMTFSRCNSNPLHSRAAPAYIER